MMDFQLQRWLRILAGMLLLFASSSIAYGQGSPVEFSGTWNTVTSKGKKIVLTLKSVDRRLNVTGTYAVNGLTATYMPMDGLGQTFVLASFTPEPVVQNISSITGTVRENILRFKWNEDAGRGAGRFVMATDGRSFQGTFSRTDDPDDTTGGTWNGTRAPVFNGVWQVKSGEQFLYPQLLLQQSGNDVSGHLVAGRPDLGLIKQGVIDGNTLRFTIWRPAPPFPRGLPDQYMGKGELVMEADGKSLKGNILGAVASGTRIGR